MFFKLLFIKNIKHVFNIYDNDKQHHRRNVQRKRNCIPMPWLHKTSHSQRDCVRVTARLITLLDVMRY